MAASNEPEKYSIDEMMERLKSRPSEDPLEDGELVTRSDGTQAIKVRKRKRRSQQPQKEMRKRVRRVRILQLSTLLFLILTVITLASAAIFFANSAPFRQKVLQMIGKATGAEVQLEEFRVNPSRAVAGRLLLKWPDGGLMRELTVRGVSASVAPSFFLGNSIHGEELYMGDTEVRLGLPGTSGMHGQEIPDQGPSPVRFERISITRLRMGVGDPTQPGPTLVDTEASYMPDSANGRAQLLLNRGKIQLLGWPLMRLDRAHIEFRDRDIDVIGLGLLHETDQQGKINLMGTITPYSIDRPSKLTVRVDMFPIEGLLGPDLGQLITGRVETETSVKSNFLNLAFDESPSTSMTLSLRNASNSAMSLRGFAFMNLLSVSLEENWYREPVFQNEIRCTIIRRGAEVTIKDLYLEEKARMALRGELRISADRRLEGTLDVGIPGTILQASGQTKFNDVFGNNDLGYRWMTLKISGVGNKPTDDFLTLVDESRPPDPKAAPSGKVPTFEELTNPE